MSILNSVIDLPLTSEEQAELNAHLESIDSGRVEAMESDISKAWIRQNWWVSRERDSQGRRVHLMTENGEVKQHYFTCIGEGVRGMASVAPNLSWRGRMFTWKALQRQQFKFTSATWRNAITGETLHHWQYLAQLNQGE